MEEGINPYEVLGITRSSSNNEINEVFAKTIKENKYPSNVIAKARKILLNPNDRIIADYFSPIISIARRFRSADSANNHDQTGYSLEKQLTPTQIEQLIQAVIGELLEQDREMSKNQELANLVWEKYIDES